MNENDAKNNEIDSQILPYGCNLFHDNFGHNGEENPDTWHVEWAKSLQES